MKNEVKKERVLLTLNNCATLTPIHEIDDPNEYSEQLGESTVLVGDGTYNGVFFPADEISKAFLSWDKQPININHSSDISDEVGFVTNPRYDVNTKQFKVTPVLNKETAKYDVVNGYIRNRIKAGRPPEVSIGVWVDREYEQMDDGDERIVARNLSGDHLAIVCRGACSPQDGCGIGLEHDKSITVDNDTAHFTIMFSDEDTVDVDGERNELKKKILQEKIKKLQLEEK